MKGFKKCSNGHWYKEELATCPYCPGGSSALTGSEPTQVNIRGNDKPTEVFGQGTQTPSGTSTVLINPPQQPPKGAPSYGTPSPDPSTPPHTIYVTGGDPKIAGGEKEYRNRRRLVGWLATYSLDPLGVDFKLYEGKNLIGRDVGCNVTISDPMVSGKHATLLFRADKYIIKDELSAHGTFVNGEDIGTDAFELQDGDFIKMGETMLIFKSSLP
jgi:hypothetical protein